ncbi:MAG: aspartate--tRNA(Asn) ligase [Nanoarchaeota archaeon]
MERTLIKDLKTGKDILLKGWIYELRVLSKMAFILLRDSSGIVQGIIKDKEILKKISGVSLESVVEIKGKIKKANVKADFARKDIEVEIIDFEIINRAEKLPIHINEKTTTTALSKRLDYRFLDIRKPKVHAIFKIQSTIMQAYREFMINEGAMEVNFPSIISASSEGGTELYSLKYFEKKAFLSQSCQLYKQMLACAVEKVFTIFTVWRAEKHNTLRHLNEARQLDFEMAFADEFEVMDVMAKCVQHIVKKVLEKNKEELELLNVDLKIPKVKYLTFEKANELLKKNKIKTEKKDLTGEGEKKLGELFPDTIVFVHDWPIEGKPFYILPKQGQESLLASSKIGQSKEKNLSHGFDAIYQGMEITSGGQRVHIPEILEKQLRNKKLNPKDFKTYIDSFRFGAPPHAGWGIGLERLTMLILGIENIREVVLFPRDRERLTP